MDFAGVCVGGGEWGWGRVGVSGGDRGYQVCLWVSGGREGRTCSGEGRACSGEGVTTAAPLCFTTPPLLPAPRPPTPAPTRVPPFPGVLNALMARDAAARRRGLSLRTYAVLPLQDDCGILQWVDNLVPFKARSNAWGANSRK